MLVEDVRCRSGTVGAVGHSRRTVRVPCYHMGTGALARSRCTPTRNSKSQRCCPGLESCHRRKGYWNNNLKPDPRLGGVWLCVLTADHVVSDSNAWRIGFGNINQGWQYNAPIRIRGPRNPDETWVDLALLGVHVPDPTALPEIALPTLSAPQGNQLIVAGFGNKGDLDPQVPRSYLALSGTYGVFRSGQNEIVAIEQSPENRDPDTDKIYKFQSLKYQLRFTPADRWPPQTGTAYPFAGDSGGPSFQAVDLNRDGDTDDPGEWRLVGVHSSGEIDPVEDMNGDMKPEARALEGHTACDVSVGNYIRWINEKCDAIPEPASMVALAVGLLGLVARRRRSK